MPTISLIPSESNHSSSSTLDAVEDVLLTVQTLTDLLCLAQQELEKESGRQKSLLIASARYLDDIQQISHRLSAHQIQENLSPKNT